MLNAFYGNKKVIIVNESGCKLGKEIATELRKNNFNNVKERNNLNFCAIADTDPGLCSGSRGERKEPLCSVPH